MRWSKVVGSIGLVGLAALVTVLVGGLNRKLQFTRTTVGNPLSADVSARLKTLDMPLGFEPNRGQTDARVKFLVRASGYRLFIEHNESVIALSGLRSQPRQGHAASRGPILEPPPQF